MGNKIGVFTDEQIEAFQVRIEKTETILTIFLRFFKNIFKHCIIKKK